MYITNNFSVQIIVKLNQKYKIYYLLQQQNINKT